MEFFVELAAVIVIATAIAGVMRLLKQPLIMGHILTGLIVGPQILGLFQDGDTHTFEAFSQLGVAILLFIVGLSLSPKVIKEVGKAALLTGLGQITFTSIIGFLLARAFGYSTVTSFYIAFALAFSSTIIIMKLIADKKDLGKLYAKIAIGFLLVQDVVATLLLVGITTISQEGNLLSVGLLTLLKGILVAALLVVVSSKILPKLGDFFAKSPEYLFLFSIAWGFGLAALFKQLGFSIEVGALMAGVALSVSPYAQEIGAKLKPLRDFFIIMFFILLGSGMVLAQVQELIVPVLVLSVFVLVGNPLIVMTLMGLLGYTKKTGFLAGLAVAQISEFSLILALLGFKVGHLEQSTVSLLTLVGLITIAGSTYLVMYAEKIYPKVAPLLTIFEKKHRRKKELRTGDGIYDVVLFGCNRTAYDFVELFGGLGKKFLAVDFDPNLIKNLKKKKINCRYGDMEDPEFLDELNLENTKLIVSTVPDFEASLFLLAHVRKMLKNEEAVMLVISYDIEEALKYYENEATYVILPHFLGGELAAAIAEGSEEAGFDVSKLVRKRKNHINYLNERKRLGHKHPKWAHH